MTEPKQADGLSLLTEREQEVAEQWEIGRDWKESNLDLAGHGLKHITELLCTIQSLRAKLQASDAARLMPPAPERSKP